MRKAVELRVRRRHGSFRLQLGIAKSRAELAALEERKRVLRRLADRGEWDVLEAVKSGRASAEEVERLIDQMGVDNYRARFAPPPAPEPEVPALDAHVAAWLATIERDSTRNAYRKAMPHLLDHRVDGVRLGARPWHRIARHTIRDVKAALTQQTNTVRLFMGAWSSFFSWAIEREESEAEEAGREPIIRENPVRQAKAWSPIERTRHRFLSWAEFERLLEASPAPMRAQYATLVLAALRIDELMNLPPAHVHLPTHVHVGPWGTWGPKGYPRYTHGVRDVPLHRGTLVPLLEEYAASHAGTETFFVNPNTGRPWIYSNFRYRLKKDVAAAGLQFGQYTRGEAGIERRAAGITAHTFRHTLASWMAQQDVQLMKIARILGDTEETVRLHYAHLLPSDLDQSVNRVGLPGALTDQFSGGAENG